MKITPFSGWLVCAGILLSCSSLRGQVLLPQLKKNHAREAMNNARQIGLMLLEFDNEYGSFPSGETRGEVENSTGEKLPADDKSSNSVFRQFFAAGITQNEGLFHAKIPGVEKGDNNVAAGNLLTKGENGFAYISGMNAAGNPARPILVCPLIEGTTKFDPKPFGGKAIILRVDCSVQMLAIEGDGRVLENGVELLSKENPLWKGKAPDIRYPDLLPVAK